MSIQDRSCDYCGLPFSGNGYSTDGIHHYCCYGCHLVQQIVQAKHEEGIAAWIMIRLGIGAFLAMNVMMISLLLYVDSANDLGVSAVRGLHWALLVLSTPAVTILSGPFIVGTLRDLRSGRLGMDGLILTGSMAAYLVSAVHVVRGSGHIYFDTATMLLLIVTLGRLIEATAKTKTSDAIKEIAGLLPSTAHVLREDEEVEVALDELSEGNLVVVRPGEQVPADGRILSGESLVVETAFTGEARPRPCSLGDSVFGGSVTCDGLIRVEVTAVGSRSVLSQIQEMVRHAQNNRAPIERLTQQAAAIFVPLVWIVAAAAGIYWGVLHHDTERASMSALAVLVVACPCALGLATPIATCLAIGRAARSGVLIRSGEVLERLAAIRKVFFDKTGTLTTGCLTVHGVYVAGDEVTESDALAWAAALESNSEHAIGQAVVTASHCSHAPTGKAISFRTIPGQGVRGLVQLDGETRYVTVGSQKLLYKDHEHSHGADIKIDVDHLTTVFVGWDGKVQASIALRDSIRTEAIGVIASLRTAEISVSVISGDREGPTRRVADELGIDNVFAECSPLGKIMLLKDARKPGAGGIAMVGDGINDAPALAEADVGIAIGGGTDLARQASDMTLIGDDLSLIPEMISLSRLTYCVIRQNLWWAFGYNSLAISAAFLGYVHPLIAATAMLASSSTVIAHSMRVTHHGKRDDL